MEPRSAKRLPLPLPRDEIHLWTCHDRTFVDPGTLARFETMLAPEELARRERFHFERDRHQYLITRAILRTLLSLYRPDVAPRAWRFRLNPHGRPSLAQDFGHEPFFNLSHTDGLIVLAFARREIGVDVENLDRTGDLSTLADQYFAPVEQEDLAHMPEAERRHRFVELWTLKEAYVKACGVGLSQPLDTFSFRLGARGPGLIEHRSDAECRDAWRFWSVRLPGGYCMALAARTALTDPEPTPRICAFTPQLHAAPVPCLRVWRDEFGTWPRSPFLEALTAPRTSMTDE